MTSIIKNQILKHLSKFAKNLTADKINISTMRGEGEMSNLELNEAVMTDLLELPAWMRITRVWCNRVTVRIHWTKLKSVPIYVSLDEVQVAMETCDELRPMAAAQPAYASGGRYGFSDKVIDGMTVTVNSCCVMFKSHAFEASVQVSRIVLESKSPSWQRSDLRMTRLRDPDRGEVLIFKELQWQTVKMEARSTLDQGLSPLRLITNQSHCRIVIKKKINDCSVMGCRLVLILDDLLWVLTDEQMKAALHFLDSLSGLIQKATEHSHQVKAVRKLESLPEYQAQQNQSTRRSQGNTALSRVFAKYDVVETSYHLYSDRIDLHLCDDPGEGRSCAPELEAGGALQVTFKQLELDYYPYHLAYGDRRHWVRYGESIPAQWLDQALSEFRSRLTALLLNGGPHHTRLARAPPHLNNASPAAGGGGGGGGGAAAGPAAGPPPPSPHRSFVMNQLRKLMSAALVVRINDFVIYRVSTSQRKTVLKEFVMGRRAKRSLGPRPSNLIFCSPRDRERTSVPGQSSSVHVEMTYFYYPGNVRFP
ncbi:UHRF1-binding protein 1-like, partial [Amphibalanus amphitrite]|uniref:UHRF1-binding protein 1-like n=1 Tax=Amphibalanus amphitrite TaxID=1232801 RepID=UPI001C928D3B